MDTVFLCFLLQFHLLVKQSPEVIEYQAGTNKVFYDSTVSRSDALLLLDHLRSGNSVDPVPYIYHLPNNPNRFVVSAWTQIQKEEPQRRLIVLSKDADGIREVYKSPGAGDSWILKPTFFVGIDRVLILAELGAEEYYGLVAFELVRDKVTCLGRLDVGRRVNRLGVIDVESPLSDSKIEYVKGTYCISLFGDIYVDSGLPTQRKISDSKRLAKITYDGSCFRVVPLKLALCRSFP